MTPPIRPEELFTPDADREILRLPLGDLAARQDQEVTERDLFRRAARSALYRERWRTAKVQPDRLSGRAGLRGLPFLEGSDLLAMVATARGLREALLALPRAWVTSHGGGPGTKKWLPLTLADTAHWFGRVRRVNNLLGVAATAEALALVLNEPLPRVSNAVPYLWERADYLAGQRKIEFIFASLEMLGRNHWEHFAVQKRPQWLISSVKDACCLSGELGADAGRLLRDPRCGVFWGAPLDSPGEVRAELAETYGLAETFSLYFSAECREMYAECRAHAGLHLWMDGAIHEIIPDGQSQALLVDQAQPGTEGEYVVTTFYEALPLVRYRSGDRIRLVDTAPCACGITHPRVQFLGRQAQS